MRKGQILQRTPLHTIIKAILVRRHVGTDEEILAEIHMSRPDTKFTCGALRVYKRYFRAGSLPGMDGKCHGYNQPTLHMEGFRDTRSKARRKRAKCAGGGCDYCEGRTDTPIIGVPPEVYEDAVGPESNPPLALEDGASQTPKESSPEATDPH